MQQIVNVMKLMDSSDATPQQIDDWVDQLLEDDLLQQKWHNYHLVQDCMLENEQPLVNVTRFVEMALINEPVYRQDRSLIVNEINDDSSEVKNIRFLDWFTPRAIVNKLSDQLASLGQVAVAASVTMLVVIGVQQYNQNQAGELNTFAQTKVEPIQTTPVLNTKPVFAIKPAEFNQVQTVNLDYGTQQTKQQLDDAQLPKNFILFLDHDLQRRLNYTPY